MKYNSQQWPNTLVASLLVALLLSACGGEVEQVVKEKPVPEVEVVSVQPGLNRTFQTTGEVQASKSANFLAESRSSIQELHVTLGEQVATGQLLVTLEAESIDQQYSTTSLRYSTAYQNLRQTQITGQRGVREAQIALKTAQINLEKLLKENAARLRQAEETLNAAQLNFNLDTASAQASVDASLRKTRTTVQEALTNADELLEFSPQQEGLDYEKETHIGVRDPAQKRQTIDALQDAYNYFQGYQTSYEYSIDLLTQTEQALLSLITTLNNSVTSPDYTISELNSNIEEVNDHVAAVRGVISELENAKRSLDRTKQQTTGNNSQVIIDAQAAYDTTVAQLEAAEEKARLEIERTKSALESTIASAEASEISARSNLAGVGGDLQQARIDQSDLTITAPFAGFVTELPERVGRELQAGELVVAVENDDMLKVVTFVSAEEVKHIKVGDVVEVGSPENTAPIHSIAPSADPQSKKFRVEIFLSADDVTPGEFVTLTYRTKDNTTVGDAVFLPVTSVHVSAADTYVWVVNRQTGRLVASKQPVTIGRLSGKFVEITSGISVGDDVIVEGGRFLETEGVTVKIAQ